MVRLEALGPVPQRTAGGTVREDYGECPTGSGKQMSLFQVSEEIANRLIRIFLRDEKVIAMFMVVQ